MLAQKANCPATKKIQTIALGDLRNSQLFGLSDLPATT